mmetsp:Transcript_110741/g.292439  ORF Transcript_110741/g.292439 Transcript_110741/m.292439 type:complete len:412 (-) Transcript_110741:673-1908(-)
MTRMWPPIASSTAWSTPLRAGSMLATRPTNVRSLHSASNLSSAPMSWSAPSKPSSWSGATAMASTRRASEAKLLLALMTSSRICWVNSSVSPSLRAHLLHTFSTRSGAPLTTVSTFEPLVSFRPASAVCEEQSCAVSIIFRDEEKGTSNRRGNIFCPFSGVRSIFCAATTSGASEELPTGFHLMPPVGSVSFSMRALLFSKHDSSVVRTEGFSLASWLSLFKILPSGTKPEPSMSKNSCADHSFTVRILPSVRVPVLSVQMIEALPSVSTAASFLTSTCFFCISVEPNDREIVTQRGMPSGIAATASVTETRIMYSQVGLSSSSGSFVWRSRPTMNTKTHTPIAMPPIFTPRRCRLSCRGVMLPVVSGRQPQVLPPSLSAVIMPAILPTSVSMAVRMTMPLPLPLFTSQPE